MQSLLYSVTVTAMSAFMLCSQVHAEEFWAEGVSKNSGWYDTNKAYNPLIFYGGSTEEEQAKALSATKAIFPNSDRDLCWAGSTSNILLHMKSQKGYDMEQEYSSTYRNASGATKHIVQERHQYAIYETFVNNFADDGYNAYDAMAWYTTGSSAAWYAEEENYEHPYRDPANADKGGYFVDRLGDDSSYYNNVVAFNENVLGTHYQLYGEEYIGDFITTNSDGTISVNDITTTYVELFKESLNYSAIALGVNEKDNEVGHALTCWGFETNSEGELIKLFITDSDDAIVHLQEIEAYVDKDTGLLMLGKDLAGVTAPVYDAEGNELNLYYAEADYTNYYVSDFGSFQNVYLQVPEPSTATLSMVALGCLLLRRRLH